MKESLQSRISKAQIRLAHRQSLFAGNFVALKNRIQNNLVSPKALIMACIIGFVFGRYMLAAGLIKPVNNSIKPLIRASVLSGYSVIWRRVINVVLNIYRSSRNSAKGQQIISDRDASLT